MIELAEIARNFGANAALLIFGLRWRHGCTMPAEERFLASLSDVDGDLLATQVQEHGLSPADVRHPVIISALPDAWWSRFTRHHEVISKSTLVRVGEMQALNRSFEEAGIDVRFWKGPLLSLLLYGDLTTRPTRDIDVLIRPDDLMSIRQVLRLQGYVDELPLRDAAIPLFMQTHREWVMRRTTNERLIHYVELQWSPAMPWSMSPTAQDMAFSGRQVMDLGRSPLPVPEPETHWLMLAAHHGYSEGWRQLRQVSDMAAFAMLPPGRVNMDLLLELSERYGLKRTFTVGLGLAQRLAGVPVPSTFIKSVNQEERLIRRFADRMLRHPIPRKSEESMEAIRRQWLLADNTPARWSLLRGHLRKRLAPGYVELAHVRLPASLAFLYTPLKLMRPLTRRLPIH